MKRHPLATLVLAFLLGVQGVALAAGGHSHPRPAAAADDGADAMPCHGDESPAAADEDCCGTDCACDLHCGAAALVAAPSTPIAPVPASPAATPRVPPVHAAYPDPRLRPPDSVLA